MRSIFTVGMPTPTGTPSSGSSGNSTFVATERTRLLVDAGLSFKETCKRLVSIGENPERLDAILITHEHSDHVCGLPRLARTGLKKAWRS